ncbi:DUF805 domain-containing protein [Staphylococcus shinii]|uniref:DUF805 domain-containing protein n=1 Tax=Staphylococcus shinii TaxID=2912228 RepID=UPI000D1F726C|nr:DUF805 domain-containing protein [Staphylococcus shinii]PTI65152.1 DUF805 domain-containing protein [Staphylococcus shinii]
MIHYYKLFWINALKIKGRSRRKEYWYPILMTVIISVIASILNDFLPVPHIIAEIIYWVFNIATIIATFTVMVRRLHDIGMSMLLPLIIHLTPLVFLIIGIIVTLINPQIYFSIGSSLVLVAGSLLYLVISIIAIVICCIEGHKNENKYGINPKTS